jgi:uncharacterized protein (TIGR02001 family)
MNGSCDNRSRWRATVTATLLSLALPGVTAVASAAQWAGSVGIASDYVLRGISINDGDPALQGDVHLRFARGWSAGLWGSEVQLRPNRHSLELDTYLQWRQPLNVDFDLGLSVTHYAFPRDPRSIGYDYSELGVSLAWREQIYATVAYSPAVNLFTTYGYIVERDKRVYTFEVAAHRSLTPHLDALVGLGFYGPRNIDYASYTYGSATLGWHYGNWRADLALIAVQGVDHRWYTQGKAGGPVTLSLSRSF